MEYTGNIILREDACYMKAIWVASIYATSSISEIQRESFLIDKVNSRSNVVSGALEGLSMLR